MTKKEALEIIRNNCFYIRTETGNDLLIVNYSIVEEKINEINKL